MSRRQSRTNLRTSPEQIAFAWPGEEWRPIAGYDGYFVSSYGRVCSVDRVVMRSNDSPQLCRGRILRPKTKNTGHLVVTLSMRNTEYVHLLVLKAFVGPCPEGCEGLHRDDNPTHNAVSNLRWGTRSQNLYDAISNGKKPVGEQNWNAKLTEDAVRFIRANPHLTLTGLANQFGVCRETIAKVRDFRMWRYVQ